MEGHSPAPVKTLAARTSGAMLRESRRAVLCGFSACAAALFLPALAGCSDDLPAQKASMVLAAAPRDAKPAAVETVPALSSFLAAYEVAGRLDLAHSLDALKQALLSFSHSCTSVQLCDHALALVSYIDSRRSLPKPFNGNVEEDGKLLELLLAIAANDEEKGERVFSSRFFGDSKTFEKQWKDRVLIFLRQAFRNEGVEGDEELLSLFSLRRYPAILPFRGNARLIWKDGPVTQWRHCMGVGYLDTSSLDLLEGIDIDDAAVLSIENKESFYGLDSPEGLFVVYHGGFSGKAARQWHRMLASNRCRFFHWGDIDLGGMDIFVQLKGDIPALEPFMMDVDTLERYSDKAQKLGGKAYRDRLSSRQGKDGYEVFDDLVARMLDEDRRLEQENISVDEATLEALLV